MPPVDLFCLFEFEGDQSVEVGPVTWIVDEEKRNLEPEDLLNKEVDVRWKSNGKTQSTHSAKVVAVNASKEKLISKRKKLCKGESMETDIEAETGRGKRRKKARTYSSSESDCAMDIETTATVPTKKVKSKMSHCNEMAKELRKQVFGGTQMKSLSGLKKADTSVEVADLQRQLEKLRKELHDLQGKQVKEKAAREKLQQQLLFFQGIPTFIDTFKGFMVEMQDMSKVKQSNRDEREMSCSSELALSSSTSQSSTTQSSPSSGKSSKPQPQQISLSPKVALSKTILQNCNSSDYRKYTCDLMLAVFGRPMLISSSLTGAKNAAGLAKPPLDSEKIQGIINHVKTKYEGVSSADIRIVMRNKVGNEAKLAKKKSEPTKQCESKEETEQEF